MKAFIISVMSVIIAVAGFANTASATIVSTNTNKNNGDGFYLSANGGYSLSGWSKMGIKDGKFYIEGEQIFCHKTNVVMGGQMTTGDAKVNKPTPNLPSADTNGCTAEHATEVVTNPPANSTVTISGVCSEMANKLKANITGTNVTVIINGDGPCDKGTITVTPPAPDPTAKEAKAETPAPAATDPKGGQGTGAAELPQTGNSEVVAAVIAAVLAAGAYAGTRAFRAIRG